MKIKKFLNQYILPLLMIFLIIIVWSSADFLKESSGFLPKIMAKNLPFKVNPVVSGGEIIAIIDDDVNDNMTLSLPDNTNFKDGYKNADLIMYKIHNPIKEFDNNWIWNIDLVFNELKKTSDESFDLIKGVLYIDINDGDTEGNNISYSADEKIRFSSDFKWDYYVSFDYLHKKGTLFSNKTHKKYDVNVSFIPKDELIRLSLPIIEKLNKNMDKKYMGSHIAAVGFYSPFEKSELLAVNTSPTEESQNITPYYDFIAGSVNESIYEYIEITPIILENVTETNFDDELDKARIKLENISKRDFNSSYGKIEIKEIKLANDLIDQNKLDQAAKLLTEYLDDSSIANTLYGLLQAKKAGDKNTSITKKVDYINSSYKYFDKAENLIKNDDDLYILLVNRIGVSTSIPDHVFNKLSLAEKDLKRILSLNLVTENKAKMYLKLFNIYKEKDKKRELKILINQLKKLN
jgi:hypothetical protein